MNNQIIVLTIPGIGTKKPGYSEKLENDVRKFAKKTSLKDNFRIIESRPFSVTEIDDNQDDTFRRLDATNNLGGILSPRKFVMEAFGDGVTFERNASDPDGPYQKIHRYLKEKIEEVNQIMLAYDKAILVIVAASMGAHLLSTYIWDADHNRGIFEAAPSTEKNNLRNLWYLATIGCNIPLFISGLQESQVIAFDKRNVDFTWDNFYDKDDVLGWPLRQLSPSYNTLVTDYQINTGLYVGAHVRYWKDNDFTKPFTGKLVELYESMG
ncbi:MAG: hypothetical protein K9H64_10105 [Bacteroidales bacterium]|nr:hypothetical protein [Bacteroidales bacterium]MCF8456220.1 hypothetical protein [Bacteroidales bacterium]